MTARTFAPIAPGAGTPQRRRRELIVAGLGVLAGLPSRPAAAGAFPERAVRIVVPYSVGVGPDVIARSVAERLARQWGQPVIVDNKPGASGIVAFGEVRRTPADGHTLFLGDTATLAVNPLLHAALPYDPVLDLVPLTLLFRATFLLWVGGESRFGGVAALLEAARRSPGSVSYATLGNGHASHVAIETFARAAGVSMLHVPFKDAGAMLSAVAVGDVDFTAIGMNTASGLMATGKLRPIAVAAKRRLRTHPDIPTLVEAGGPPVEMHPWAALVAVARTAPPVLDQLRRDIAVVLETAEVRSRAENAGFEITPSTPQALSERIEADVALYAPLIREGRIARL
ncbi:MAG TPA: tripartite tricarboxylate transporter substrate binding protein [Caldimonas sp.]|nr:tripartite tricarboxylate transporter substrate binding protein [Caldimonas sp.]